MILILDSSNNPLSPGTSLHSVLQEYCSSSLAVVDDNGLPYHYQISRLFHEYHPKIVLNCHEYHDIDAAEYDRETAYEINSCFVKTLAGICRDGDVKLIQLSTSYVFNGSGSTPYREEDEPVPISVYGDSKLLGERYILESGCRQMIIRVPDMFGDGVMLLSGRLGVLHDESSFRVLRGQVVAPASSGDLARAISVLISMDAEGLYHYGQGDGVSTADYVNRALELTSRHGAEGKKISVREVEKEDFLAPGERPMYNVLDNGRLLRAAGAAIRGWETALEDYISRYGASIIPG